MVPTLCILLDEILCPLLARVKGMGTVWSADVTTRNRTREAGDELPTTPQPSQLTPSQTKISQHKVQPPSPSSLSTKRQCHAMRLFCTFLCFYFMLLLWMKCRMVLKIKVSRRTKERKGRKNLENTMLAGQGWTFSVLQGACNKETTRAKKKKTQTIPLSFGHFVSRSSGTTSPLLIHFVLHSCTLYKNSFILYLENTLVIISKYR